MKIDFKPADLCSITILSFFFFFVTETLIQMKDYVKSPVLGAEI